jgi:hypothetical protein
VLKIDRIQGKLMKLKSESLTNSGLTERADLQELIFHNADDFFARECGEDLFLLAQEVCPSKSVADRIDLLAIDAQGKTVVIELKRGSHKLQLLQALSYAAMVSAEMVGRQALEALIAPSRKDEFSAFVSENDIEFEEANSSQRIILIAESYDYEVLQTARWLTENHGLNITCYELALALDHTSQAEYLSAVQLYPPKGLAQQARQRGALRSQEENRFPTLEERLAESTNPVVKQFLDEWLKATPRRNRRLDSIVLPQNGKMRFRVTSRRGYARITQLGRFAGDEAKWAALSPATMKIKPDGLQFQLATQDGLAALKKVAEEEIGTLVWINGVDTNGSSEDEDSGDE